MDLADCLKIEGKITEARTLLQRALDGVKKNLGEDNSLTKLYQQNLDKLKDAIEGKPVQEKPPFNLSL